MKPARFSASYELERHAASVYLARQVDAFIQHGSVQCGLVAMLLTAGVLN